LARAANCFGTYLLSERKKACIIITTFNGVPEDDGLLDELLNELDSVIQAENEGGKATWLDFFSTRNYLWKRKMLKESMLKLTFSFLDYYGDNFFQGAGIQ
jgi:SP family sugar:H+ symporter-like MFS transporter